jgi:2-methylisocitrate lyase-like PEP mutase family enzyme
MTGAGSAASVLGMPDLGAMTLDNMLSNARMIASLDRTVPLIADADTGYGGPVMVARTVQSYMSAGIAGLHLEDQVVNKRCGHLANKELVDEDVFYSRIRAAVLAREEYQDTTGGGDVVLIARTDALQSFGYDVAIHRLRRAAELGADVAFLEGITSKEMCVQAVKDLAPTPVLLNMVAGGVTPDMSVAEAQSMGFRVMIYPCFALEPVYHSVSRAARELKGTGNIVNLEKGCKGIKEVFRVCGLDGCMEFDGKAGGTSYGNGFDEHVGKM